LKAFPALTDNLLGVTESIFTTGNNRGRYTELTGETVFSLKAWRTDELLDTVLSARNDAKSELDVREVEGDFSPGTFNTAKIELTLPSQAFPDVRTGLQGYLRNAYVPVNFRRTQDSGSLVLDLPPRSMKKRIILGGELVEQPTYTDLRLHVTPKFQLMDFLKAISKPEALYRLAGVEVIQLEL
jgi:hypothetical protein